MNIRRSTDQISHKHDHAPRVFLHQTPPTLILLASSTGGTSHRFHKANRTQQNCSVTFTTVCSTNLLMSALIQVGVIS